MLQIKVACQRIGLKVAVQSVRKSVTLPEADAEDCQRQNSVTHNSVTHNSATHTHCESPDSTLLSDKWKICTSKKADFGTLKRNHTTPTLP